MSSAASLPAYLLPGVSICQPSYLEGDPSFATEILPGPPPVTSIQQGIIKRDPKKPAAVYSYLPTTDPGTTYSGLMHGTLYALENASGSRKRTRDKGLASGRAQRASARSQNATSSSAVDLTANESATGSQPPPTSADTDGQSITEIPQPLSRSDSIQSITMDSKPETSGRPRRKDKGKAREVEPAVRIKEEPKQVNLNTPEPVSNLGNNNDHCSSCRSHGALVYCDGCPRAFHLWCLDPPMESIDEGDSNWFCPACTKAKNPPRKSPPSLLSPLIHLLDTSIPTEYQLPEDIRNFFKDVTTGPKGAYVDTSEIKQPRLNRHGQLEDRDAHRLRDRNGQPVLCFRCGTSALPENIAAAAPATKRARRATAKAMQYEVWKDMISCDYCNLHWHLDCLDPPLSTMPTFTKKWMCPNHSERILPPKKRIPKQTTTPIEVTKPSQWNNGNVEILESDTTSQMNSQKVAVDEVLINGRRYRIPERVILLDFWNKVSKTSKDGDDSGGGLSSPLTSLSSLDDEDASRSPVTGGTHNPHDLQVAQWLFDFQKGKASSSSSVSRAPAPKTAANGAAKKDSEILVPSAEESASTSRPVKTSRTASTQKRGSKSAVNAVQPAAVETVAATSAALSTNTTAATRRRRSTNLLQPEPSTRELRSRSRNADATKARKTAEEEPVPTPPPATTTASAPARPRVRVKLEDTDSNLSLLNGLAAEPSTASAPVKPARRARPGKKRDPEENTKEERPEKEKKSRKRKEREDDPYIDTSQHAEKTKEKKEKAKAATRLPTSTTSLSSLSTVTMTPATTSVSTPATPSLKIRIPRLNLNGSPVVNTTSKAIASTSTHLS
ncbi:hypothetical protein VNI00_008342 [Paramarasmius palmivorus]|uniref:PHD-type domain-containing protein n=1 Tax=Paramarasmius palmivorus TaxID=297713 RepID=A0AAW0CXJ0_9AGAR